MSADAKSGNKPSRLGKAMNWMLAFAALLALTYGGLFKVRTKAWPWDDWNAFASFTSVTTREAVDDARRFTREKVVPATSDLLARAQELLDDWESEPTDTGTDDPADPSGSGESGEAAADGEESLKIPAAPDGGDGVDGDDGGVYVIDSDGDGSGGVEIVADGGLSIGADDDHVDGPDGKAEAAPAPKKIVPAKKPDDLHAQGREKFKQALRHYQRSSPEMDGSQEQLEQARDRFREAQEILEKAHAADPDDAQIDRDLQEVQTFLYDCQKRLTVKETY